MAFERKDRFFHKAKADGFLARSAYKLDELQKKHQLIKPGHLILDLGAAPGAWSQIAIREVGPRGKVIGLDLKAIALKAPNAQFYVMDAFQFDPQILAGRRVNCVLSDMAPNTTGIRNTDQARSFALCEQVLDLAEKHLVDRGHLIVKIFEGPDADQITRRMRTLFASVKRTKPDAVRKGSFETYLVGLEKKAQISESN